MGVIVQFGGQTPLNLSVGLHAAGVPILGTQPESIDRAEDRKLFQAMLNKLGLIQPANGTAVTIKEALHVAETIGYPVVVRPSYVLGGRAMKIVYRITSYNVCYTKLLRNLSINLCVLCYIQLSEDKNNQTLFYAETF